MSHTVKAGKIAKRTKNSSYMSTLFEKHKKQLKRFEELKESVKVTKHKVWDESNNDDDKIISKYEKMYGSKESKFDDGLDYILEVCSDNFKRPQKTKLKSKIDQVQTKNSKKKKLEKESTPDDHDNELREMKTSKRSNNKRDTVVLQEKQNDIEKIHQNKVSSIPNKIENNLLARKMKGLFNRLTEANIIQILKQIEAFYGSYPRFEINNLLYQNIVTSLVQNNEINEKRAAEYVLVLAYLHVKIGYEITAQFLEKIIVDIMQMITEKQINMTDKTLDNYVMLLTQFYLFGLVNCQLIYDLLQRLTQSCLEKAIDCILNTLKLTGRRLVKDDSVSFKIIVNIIQTEFPKQRLTFDNPERSSFMIEAIKNYNSNSSHSQQLQNNFAQKNLLKILGSLKEVVMLNITISDILNVESNGRWWLLGSAWKGHKQEKIVNDKDDKQALLSYAKACRMNTSDRLNLFCVIMESKDYLEAFENLIQLSVKDNRLVVSVILTCCLNEKSFNYFYGALVHQLSVHDRKYRLATQKVVFEKMNDVDNFTKDQAIVFAHFLSFLLQKQTISLKLFEQMDFLNLSYKRAKLLKLIFLNLLCCPEESFSEIFNEKFYAPTLKNFRDSFKLFLLHFYSSKDLCHLSKKQKQQFKERVNTLVGSATAKSSFDF